MREHSGRCFALALGAMVAGCGSTPIAESFPSPVTGEDPTSEAAFAALAARARELVTEGVRRTGEQLGCPDPDPAAVGVELLRGRARTVCGERSFGCTSGWGDDVRVELAADAFLSGAGDLELTARHEGVHAYFRRRLGELRYRQVPPWLQEGLAIRFAGQSEAKLVDLLYEESERPGAQLVGLETPVSGNQYFEYALAMRFLDSFPGGSSEVARRIAAGEDPHGAIKAVTGLGREEFVRAARAGAEAWLQTVVTRLPEAYREGLVRERAGDFHTAMERFERVFRTAGIKDASDLAAGGPTEVAGFAPVFAFARWAAIAARSSDRLPEAISALRLLLSLPTERRGARAASLRFTLAAALVRQGNFEEALAEYIRVFRLHHEAPVSQESATLGIARILYELARFQEALQWIESYREGGGDAGEMAFLEGLTLVHLDRRQEAVGVLARLAAGEGEDPWAQRAREAIAEIESGALPAARAATVETVATRDLP